MVKKVVLHAVMFAGIAVAYGLVKTALRGEGLAVDPGLIVTLAVVGALGQVIAWRRAHRS